MNYVQRRRYTVRHGRSRANALKWVLVVAPICAQGVSGPDVKLRGSTWPALQDF